jgi:hypothetical protein
MNMNTILGRSIHFGSFLSSLVMAIMFFCTAAADAQFVPAPYYYSDAGVIGAATAAYQSAAQAQAYAENRQLQATSSMARSLAWQNINRTMQSEAMSRPATVTNSAQAARDWMFQNAPSSRYASRPMTLPRTSMAMLESADVAQPTDEETASTASQEIMLWPTILKDPLFDKDRASVEAPFRRAYADGKPLTIEDYQNIIKTVENMKATVTTLKSSLVESEYASVQKYLDELIADAQNRIRAREETQAKQ